MPKSDLLGKLQFIEEKHSSIESWLEVLVEPLDEVTEDCHPALNQPEWEKIVAREMAKVIRWMEDDFDRANHAIESLLDDIKMHAGCLDIAVIDLIVVDGEAGHLRNGKKFCDINSSFAPFDACQLTDEEENSDNEDAEMADVGPVMRNIFDDDSDDEL